MHDERREATARLAKTFGMLDLRSITGHKDLRMLARYYNPDPKELAKRMHSAGLVAPNETGTRHDGQRAVMPPHRPVDV